MQFQVPQFIDVEDHIIGPLTLKQFLYLAGAGGFSFIAFFMFQTWLWIIATVILGAIAGGLAFVKYNGQTLLTVLLAAFRYSWEPKFYLWHRVAPSGTPSVSMTTPSGQSNGVIKDLLFKLTTSTQAIGSREKSASLFHRSSELTEKFESFKRQTGDSAVAHRVDYR